MRPHITRIGNWMFVGYKSIYHRHITQIARAGFYPTPGYKNRKFSAFLHLGDWVFQVYPATLDIR